MLNINFLEKKSSLIILGFIFFVSFFGISGSYHSFALSDKFFEKCRIEMGVSSNDANNIETQKEITMCGRKKEAVENRDCASIYDQYGSSAHTECEEEVKFNIEEEEKVKKEDELISNLKKNSSCLEIKTFNDLDNNFYQRCYAESVKLKCEGLDEWDCEEKVAEEIIRVGSIKNLSINDKAGNDLAAICSRGLVGENGKKGLIDYDGGICKDFGNTKSGFSELGSLMQRLLDWIVGIAYLLAVISIFWGGFMLLTADGDPGKMTSAKNILISVVKGLFVITAAWLIVDFLFGLFIDTSKVDIDDYKFTNQNPK